MNAGVAVRAARIKGPGPRGRDAARRLVQTVAFVALETEKGLPGFEQRRVDGTVRVMAVGAVLADIRMLIAKGAPLVGMALNTGLFDRVLAQGMIRRTAVRVVTVDAEGPTFYEWVMARQGKLGLGGFVAADTKFSRGPGCDLQIRADVDIMARKAGDFVDSVQASVPVMQVEGCVCRVAFEADQRLGGGGEVF